jgi:sulfide:quinone oxidoreductase
MPKHYGDLLSGIMKKKGINFHLNMNLHEINIEKNLAIFKNQVNGNLKSFPFDLMHVSPPMKVPNGIRNTPVCSKETGLIPVNKYTM